MNIGTLEQVRKDMEHGVYDMTDNGKCIGCGNCCSNLLPMTEKEIEIIRRYIKKHNIKECKHGIPLANSIIDMTCPFLNTGKKTEKCTIYPVKPFICTAFICSNPKGAKDQKELYKEIRKVIDVRKEFFGKDKRL